MTIRTIAGPALIALAGVGLAATLAIAGTRHSPGGDDVALATTLITAMRGTAPVPCALALSVVEGNGGWGNWNGGAGIGEDSAITGLRDWLGRGLTDPAAVPILRAALTPGDPCTRQTAARLLGRSHNVTAVRALIDALRDADPTTRELGALGLGLSADPMGFDPLVVALRDTVARVRATSAVSLGRLGDRRATAKLLPLLAHDPVPTVRRAAAYALGSLD